MGFLGQIANVLSGGRQEINGIPVRIVLPTQREFMRNFSSLMAEGQRPPERVFNVQIQPSWAIDAGCD